MSQNTNHLNRRDTLKTLLIGGVGISAFQACNISSQNDEQDSSNNSDLYGRTESEKSRDAQVQDMPAFFTDHEAESLAVLIDLIVPADEISGSASDAEVLEFLQFIVKDIPTHQIPLRSGLAWLDRKSYELHQKNFINLSENEKSDILDTIAYPDAVVEENKAGEKFFSRLRNLTLTGFYTSRIGIDDLQYQGNRPNFWDGVPDDILKEHGFTYDEKYKDLYITSEKRTETATWDKGGNLI